MPDHPQLQDLIESGAMLIEALSEEARLSLLSRSDPEDESLMIAWTEARRRVEECQEIYSACLEQCRFPDLRLREIVEI